MNQLVVKRDSKRLASLVLSIVLALALLIPGMGAAPLYASGSGTEADPWHIRNAQQLSNIREHLDGHYVLDRDIDLSGVVSWKPIGAYQMSLSSMGKEDDDASTSFTGSLDGNGHTIRNLSINDTELIGGGLFGFVKEGGAIRDLTLENCNIRGLAFAGCLAGMVDGDSLLENITLKGDNNVSGVMYLGGVTGAAEDSLLKNVTAQANITMRGIPVFSQAAGIVCGGAEGSNFEDCHAVGGTIRVYGSESSGAVGSVAGCATDAKYVKNCSAENVTILVKKCSLVGGLLGHAGCIDGCTDLAKRTEISGCRVENVVIKADDQSGRIGMLLGSGYYRRLFRSQVAEPTAFHVSNCSVSGVITGGKELIGSVAGYAGRNSTVDTTTAQVLINGSLVNPMIGATVETVPYKNFK